MRLLLKLGAELDERGLQRRTALMRAAAAGHADVVQVLLEAGANPRMRDEAGATAADLARQLGHAEALASLESHAAGAAGSSEPAQPQPGARRH